MTPYHILIATDLTDDSIDILKNAGDVQVTTVAPTLQNVRAALNGAHAIITRDDVEIDKTLIEGAENLKVIGRVSAGISGVDMETATARGIMVMNTPGTSAIAAAEHTILLMLALSRKLTVAHNSLKDGWWLLDRKRQAGSQLYGKTLGVVGLGRVGRIVAERALAFGMAVLAYDPYMSEEQVGDSRIELVGFKDLLREGDYISLHTPLTRETRGMIDAQVLKQMKPGARLINTAHGSLIDDDAVAAALKEGHLGGAALDVYEEEPPYHSPLIGLDNVVHTPHIASNTVEAAGDLSRQIVQQVLDALRDVDYRNVVNMPFSPGMHLDALRPYLKLAERMGGILHLLARSPIRRVEVEYRGDEVNGLVKPLTVALLKGLLTPVLGETVSYINAPMLASQRGLQVTQVKGLRTEDYANSVSCQVTLEDNERILMTGTLLDRKEPHIVQINEYRMNFVPEGHLLIMGSYDRTGVIGSVGTLMAKNNVNIASWHTGRATPGGNTLTVLTLDQAVPQVVLDDLRTLEFVRHAHQIGF